MPKKSQTFLILIFISILLLVFYLNSNKDLRVAHAGGQYKGKVYANSIDSIEFNYKYTNYFELDLQLTKDKRLVCLHDPIIHKNLFNEINTKIVKNNFCYDETLKKLLERNKEILIITDFKTNNIEGLNFIKNYFKSEMHRFIPQIYHESEYKKVKDLGFDKIIFTFYRINNYSTEKISKVIEDMDLFAITMDPARLRSGIARKINKEDFFIYIHTVNSYLRFLQYKLFFGADEIYTDNLF